MNNENWFTHDVHEWMNATLFLMLNWKWIGIVIAIVAGLLLKSLLKKLFEVMKNAPWARTRATGFLLHFLETDLQNPVAWVLTCMFWLASLDGLGLAVGLDKYLTILVKVILCLNLIILAYRAAEAVGQLLLKMAARSGARLDDQLAPMTTKVLKILVVIFGVLISIQNFGINVVSIIAGLGLGGLALALAAQDTVANLFGSVTILMDRPFRIGDFVKIGDTEGVVEEIGFRSTRIRTPYKSLITMPNSIVAKDKVDNFQFRPQRRLRHVMGLTYDATEEQLNAFMAEMRVFFQNHPKVDQTSIAVKFLSLGDFSLNILVQFFIFTEDWFEEVDIQQEMLFYAMKAAKRTGVEFAFPTRTQNVHVLSTPKFSFESASKPFAESQIKKEPSI